VLGINVGEDDSESAGFTESIRSIPLIRCHIPYVALSLAQPATRERKVRALTDALRGLGVSRRLILADTNAEPIQENGLTIEVRSLAKWLVQG
jgi:hypothetical protein